MAVMMGKLYDALKSAAAEDDKARRAAAEVASYENRFARLEADVGLLKWMVGFNLAMTVAVVDKLFLAAH